MAETSTIRKINEELSRKINQEARSNPQSPYANKIVGIANGKVVAVGDDWDDVVQRLRQAEPDSIKCCVIEASHDYDQVEEVWSLP